MLTGSPARLFGVKQRYSGVQDTARGRAQVVADIIADEPLAQFVSGGMGSFTGRLMRLMKVFTDLRIACHGRLLP